MFCFFYFYLFILCLLVLLSRMMFHLPHTVANLRFKTAAATTSAIRATFFCGRDAQPGNPETQSVSNAGRRWANKGPRLFLTVAYFNTGGSPRPPDVYLPVSLLLVFIFACILLLVLLHSSRFVSLPGAAMTGVQGKAPVGWRLDGRSTRKGAFFFTSGRTGTGIYIPIWEWGETNNRAGKASVFLMNPRGRAN